MIMEKYTTPRNMRQILIISRYELLMFLKGRKVYAMLALPIVISAVFIGVAESSKQFLSMRVEFDLSSPISFVYYLIIILSVFFGGSSIVSEFNQKTAYLMFTNPVSRVSIWLGKFFAAQFISFSIIGLYYAIFAGYSVSISNEIPIQILHSLFFSFVSLAMMMSFTFLLSSALRGTTGVIVLLFLVFAIVLPMTDGFMTLIYLEKPWFTPSFASGIIRHSMTVPYPTDAQGDTLFFKNSFVPLIGDSLWVMIGYMVVASVSSIYVFKRREVI